MLTVLSNEVMIRVSVQDGHSTNTDLCRNCNNDGLLYWHSNNAIDRRIGRVHGVPQVKKNSSLLQVPKVGNFAAVLHQRYE